MFVLKLSGILILLFINKENVKYYIYVCILDIVYKKVNTNVIKNVKSYTSNKNKKIREFLIYLEHVIHLLKNFFECQHYESANSS